MTGAPQSPLLLPADDAPIPVPSGQLVTLVDVIPNDSGPDGLTLRFRFLAPAIARTGGTVGFDAAVADMQHLCETYALPRALDFAPQARQIVISLSDTPVTFGEATPEATQFFEAFSIENGLCIWEIY
ncbi:MAG: DUF6497 family protein [Paracoccaceae bacterium]|nr:DUF6497 family protein [Paracoccaceae bacterium]